MPIHLGEGVDRMVRVLILDDHDIARYGSRIALTAEPDIEVVGDTRVVDQALQLLAAVRPQVAIVDTLRADGDAITAARRIRSADPSVKLLLLVADAGTQAIAATLLAGASGYVLRNAAAATVMAARLIAAGHRLLDTADVLATHAWISQRLRGDQADGDDRGVPEQMLELIVAGHTDPDIMARIPLTQERIDVHLAGIVAILHLPGAAQAPVLRSLPVSHPAARQVPII
jgi:DNA-binding NarL/FixJ family response regulator